MPKEPMKAFMAWATERNQVVYGSFPNITRIPDVVSIVVDTCKSADCAGGFIPDKSRQPNIPPCFRFQKMESVEVFCFGAHLKKTLAPASGERIPAAGRQNRAREAAPKLNRSRKTFVPRKHYHEQSGRVTVIASARSRPPLFNITRRWVEFEPGDVTAGLAWFRLACDVIGCLAKPALKRINLSANGV